MQLKIDSFGKKISRMSLAFFVLFSAVLADSREDAAEPLRKNESKNPELPADKKILYINSFHISYPWSNDLQDAFHDYFLEHDIPVSMHVFELNALRNPGLVPKKSDLPVLQNLINSGGYDLVVAVDNPAVDLFFDGKLTLPERIPLLFCGYYSNRMNHKIPNRSVTGITMPNNTADTVRLGMALLPGTRKVAVITDGGAVGSNIQKGIQKELGGLKNPELILLNGKDCSTAQMLEILSGLPKESFVVFHSWATSKPVGRESSAELMKEIHRRYSGPVFETQNMMSPFGSVGGIFTSGRTHGGEAGALAMSVLTDGNAGSYPVFSGKKRPVFDYEKMLQHGLDLQKLPSNALIANRPEYFWNLYWSELILGVSIFLTLLGSSILYLWLSLRRSRTMNEKLSSINRKNRALAERLRLTLESIGDGVIATDESERITLVNPVAVKLTGYTAEEMDGKRLDECFKAVSSSEDGGRFSPLRKAIQENRIVEYSDQVILTAKDGTSYHIAESAAPIRDTDGNVAGAVLVFRDVTQIFTSQENAEVQNLLLQAAAEIAEVSYFSCSEKGEVINPIADPKFWGRRPDGELVSYQEWVSPEDQPRFVDSWRKLLQGETSSLSICYSGGENFFAKKHFFEMRVRKKCFPEMQRVEFFGIIRDLTSTVETAHRHHDISMMFQNLLENLPCYVFAKDIRNDFRILVCNQACGDLFRRPMSEIIGKTDQDLWGSTDEAKQFHAEDLAASTSGQTLETTASFSGMDRTSHCGKFYRKVLTRADGSKVLLVLIVDTTKEVERENELQETNSILHGILDNLPAMIAVKDVQDHSRYIIWNKIAEKITGIPASEILGKNEFDVEGVQELARRLKDQEDLVLPGETRKLQEHVTYPKTGSFDLHVMMTHLRLNRGNTLFLIQGLDVTEEKRLEAELRRLSEELKVYADQERLLNSCLEALVLNDVDDAAFSKVIRMLAEYTGADYATLEQYHYSEKLQVPYLAWCSPGLPKSENLFAVHPLMDDDRWLKIYQAHQILRVPDAISEEALSIYGDFGEQVKNAGIQSLYGIGIWKDSQLWGHLVFCFRRKTVFTDLECVLLQSGGHIIEIILERQNNREQVKRSEYEKLLLMDTIKIPIMLFDADLKLTRVNNAALNIAGIPEEQIYRQDCWKTFCGFDCRPMDCPVAAAKQDGQEHSKEYRIKGRDFLLTAYPILENGRLKNIIKTLIDVTAFNQIQHKLTNALVEAQSANKAKSNFLATISHELRTPLNAVLGFSELLQNTTIPPKEQKEYLHAINLAGKSLLSLINDVLDLSKIEAEQLSIIPLPVNLNLLLHEIYAVFQYETQKKNLNFVLNCPDDLPILKLDSLRLRQVLLNLIGNAVKFTSSGSIAVSAQFTKKSEGVGDLAICVKDTGIGIKPEFRKKIFQPFVQQDAVRDVHVYKGTGLGLTISQRLIARMGGAIRLESHENRGSSFFVDLHDVEYETSPLNTEGNPVLSGVASPAYPVERPLLCLIVDDVPMNLKVLSAMLHKMNVIPVSAVSGKKALEIMMQKMPDVILTDMWMPEMNGSELAHQIRKMPAAKQIRIVAVTADTEAGHNFSLDDFDAVLLKPLTMEKLVQLFSALRSGAAT